MADVEPVSGGLVTARDASLLSPGELTEARDLCYIPGSPSLHRAPGRALYSPVPLTSPAGLAYCGFDQDPDRLVALANGVLYASNVEVVSPFSAALIEQPGAHSLDSVHYNNRHVLLTGSTPNRVLLASGRIRRHGMFAVTDAPRVTVDSTSGTGAWPTGSSNLPNTFEYWATEVIKAEGEEIESTFDGQPFAVTINAVTWFTTINRPTLKNPDATHWRVYRSVGHAAGISTFPVGFRIFEGEINTDAFNDGLATAAAAVFPTTVSNGPAVGTTVTYVPGYNSTSRVSTVAWTNADRVTASDASYATGNSEYVSVGDVIHTPLVVQEQHLQLIATGFSMAGVGNPISKVEVTVKGYHGSPDGHLAIALSYDGGLHYTNDCNVHLGVSAGAPVTASVSQWNHTFTAQELASSAFIVLITAFNTRTGVVGHNLDYVSVAVTHGGTSASVSHLFPDIQVKVGGQSLLVGANGPPPPATIGDIFQDSLVTNDVEHPTRVAYSMAGAIDYFPSPYILNLETKDKDRVTAIRTLGSVCVFGLASQVQRANYLPREEDAEFDRGRCVEIVDYDNGIPGRFALCPFVLNGRLALFFLSRSGPRLTDGFRAETANDDLNWAGTVSLDSLSRAIVANNAERQEILVYYVPAGGSAITEYLRFSYHPTHLKNGKLKAIGPCGIRAVAAAVGTSSTGERVLYTLAPSGLVYQENRGVSDASGVGITPRVSTREIYNAGIGGEWQLNRAFIHHQEMPLTEITANYTVVRANSPSRDSAFRVIETNERGLSLLTPAEGGEGITLHIAMNDVGEAQQIDYLLLEGETLGPATPLSNP